MSNQKVQKRLGVVITDGVGYRNFILSTFLEKAQVDFKEVIIFSGLPKSAFSTSLTTNTKIIELEVYRESRFTWFFRKAKEVAHLQKHRKNAGIADNLEMNRRRGWSPRALMVRSVFLLTRFWHTEKAIGCYQYLQEWSFSNDAIVTQYRAQLAQNPVDILFFTHQRPPFIATLVYNARKLTIPSAAFIFSWDNLASKGRMASTFDYYLVWSNLMKEELLRFYPNTHLDAIAVVGTPQFEPYVIDSYTTKSEAFYNRFDLDKAKKIICYSCADASIGPNDPIVIATLATAIESGILKDVQLLVRTSPAEDETRFLALKDQFPTIKWNHPNWKLTREDHPEPWSQRIPEAKDIEELKAVLTHSDVFVNMCSTMSLDAMLFDKPVVNTVFGNPFNELYNDQRFLTYEHYENVVASGAVTIAKDKDQLLEGISEYLLKPTTHQIERKELIALQVGKPLSETTTACIDALRNFSNE